MSVNIYFSAEVRKDNRWIPLIWYSRQPQEEEHYIIYGGRSYHYDDALEDIRSYQGYPDNMSEELRSRLPGKEDFATPGYFMFSDLLQFLDKAELKMMMDVMQSRDMQVIKHINRIEKAILQKSIKDKISMSYLSDYSIKQIYQEYQNEIYHWVKLRNIVYYLADEFSSYPDENDIRIIYYIA